MLKDVLSVAAGSAVGGVARLLVNLAVARFWTGAFPAATFTVNVTGAFVLALFYTLLTAGRLVVPAWAGLGFATGFVGAYTTFSTLMWETHGLVERNQLAWAAANVVGSLAAGWLAVRLGVALGR